MTWDEEDQAEAFTEECAALAADIGEAMAADPELWEDAQLDCSPMLESLLGEARAPVNRVEAKCFMELDTLDLLLYDPNHTVDELLDSWGLTSLAQKARANAERRAELWAEGFGLGGAFPEPDWARIFSDELGLSPSEYRSSVEIRGRGKAVGEVGPRL